MLPSFRGTQDAPCSPSNLPNPYGEKLCVCKRAFQEKLLEELLHTGPSPSSYSGAGKPGLTFWVDKVKEVWIGLMSRLLKMDVSVFLIGSILAEFQLNLQKKIVCRKLLCSQARNYSWRELFSYPYFRPASLKIFKFLFSEQLWNPIDFVITHTKKPEFLIWHHWQRQANRITISHMEQPHRRLYSKLSDYDNDSPAIFAWNGSNGKQLLKLWAISYP